MNDPYLYEGSSVLCNLLNIHDEKELDLAEAELSRANMMLLYEQGFDDFSTQGIKTIHKVLFEDVYAWAGEFRIINIQKREPLLAGISVWYSNSDNIKRDLDAAWKAINKIPWKKLSREEFAAQIARKFPPLWQAHPFREGNTRTIVMLMTFFVEHMGVNYVVPPFCNKKTLEYGITHSPEFICLPFKVMLGDFIHGMENGADTILFCGGLGQCRLGYYGDLHAEILKSIGYSAQFICIDLTNMTIKEVEAKLKSLSGDTSLFKILMGIMGAVRTVFTVEKLYKLANYTRCREINKGHTDGIMKQFQDRVQKARGFSAIKNEILLTGKALKTIKIDKKYRPLRITVVGENYAATEPYINLEIEKKLGNMGVEVHNKLGVANWILEHFIKKILPFKLKNTAHEAGKEFIHTDDIGGHGLETVGNVILSSKNSFDGVIHIYPFTCMPEINAQCTFDEIQSRYGVPVMTLVVDEMTGEAGYMTRLEAFVDMLERKRQMLGGNGSMSIVQLPDSPGVST